MPESPVNRLFIAGRWVDSVSGETFDSVNPADTRDIVGRFQAGTAADVAMAITAADAALPAWKAIPAPKRGELPYRFGALMAEHKGAPGGGSVSGGGTLATAATSRSPDPSPRPARRSR